MNLAFLQVLIAATPCLCSNFGWVRSKSPKKQVSESRNLNYDEFNDEAVAWSKGIRLSLTQKKISCNEHKLKYSNNFTSCYQIEVEAPERDHTYRDSDGERKKVVHKNEISLYNLLSYSVYDQKKTKNYWTEGIDKVNLITENNIKCEIVLLPLKTLSMTMATEGSVSFSQIDGTSVDKAWKVGSNLEMKTPSLGILGTVSVTISGYYSEIHSSSKTRIERTTNEALPGSPCTPSLVKSAIYCHPTRA